MKHHEIVQFGSQIDTIASYDIHPDLKMVHKFGQNDDLDGAAEDIWTPGGDWSQLADAAALEIVSSGPADTLTGTGAQTVHVFGLDDDFAMQDEIVEMDGATPVALANTYKRIFRAHTETVGTGLVNASEIDIRLASAGAVQGRINAGKGQTLMAIYTIPAGWTGLIREAEVNVNGEASTAVAAEAVMMTYDHVNSMGWRTRHTWQLASNGGTYVRRWEGGIKVTEKTDIKIRSLSNTGANRIMSAQFDILLFRNVPGVG